MRRGVADKIKKDDDIRLYGCAGESVARFKGGEAHRRGERRVEITDRRHDGHRSQSTRQGQ